MSLWDEAVRTLKGEKTMSRWDAAVKALQGASEGNRELDQMCWAAANAHDYPLAHYDLDVWEQALREGALDTALSSNIDSTLRFMQREWPDVRVGFQSTSEITTADVRIPEAGVVVEAHVQREVPLTGASVVLAEAFAKAHQEALDLQQKLLAVTEAIELAPPPAEWPMEKASNGRIYAVCHEHRLAGPEIRIKDTGPFVPAERWNARVAFECRTRYETIFADVEPVENAAPKP